MIRPLILCIFLMTCVPAWAGDGQIPLPGRDNPAAPGDTRDEYRTLDTMFSIYQPYLKNISAYKPTYFLAGTDPKESKFQISFKYRILASESAVPQKYRWKENLYLAYTQTSFWDLKSSSQPFEDTSYKPEVFFLSPNVFFKTRQTGNLFFQSGFQHESNGQGGDLSRSTNYFYFQPIYIYFHPSSRIGVMVSPRIRAFIAKDTDNNPDLEDYRGYFDLEVKAGKAERLTVGTHFRMARKGASVTVDLTYPLNKLLATDLNLYVHVQYANTLAESLLNYKDRVRALRIGFSIVR